MRTRGMLLLGSLLALGLAAGAANAATIGFSPSSVGPVGPGAGIQIDVVISGVGDTAANTVGAYDFDVTYDPSVVMFIGFTYNPFLGATPDDAIVGSGAAGGIIDFAAVSLLDAADLIALQPASFALGTLELQAIAPGFSLLNFTETIVSDADGFDLPIGSAGEAFVQVVPEPGTGLLLAAGLTALAGARRRTG